MKQSLFFLFLIVKLPVIAQTHEQLKADSACLLVQKYLNNKNYDSLYELTGYTFRTRVPLAAFKRIANTAYASLGKMEQATLKKLYYGNAWYETRFTSDTLTLILKIDSSGKLEYFRLKKEKDIHKLPSNNSLATELDKKVDAMAQRIMMQEQSVGLSIGVLKDGKVHFYGYGETAKGSGKIPDATTVFELASITKVFTATLLATAVEEGKLQLNDPVNKYLPDSIQKLKYNNRAVTLKDLVSHVSAIPFMPSNFDSAIVNQSRSRNLSYSTSQLYSFLNHLQLSWQPGTRYRYSNAAFGVLAAVLESVYHQSYRQLLTKYICNPLSLNDTKTFIANAPYDDRAQGYNKNGEPIHSWNHQPVLIGHGGLASSTRDMLKFAQAQFEKKETTLDKAIGLTHDTSFSDGQVTVGLAWLYIQPGHDIILHHTGATEGYDSYFAVNTRRKIAVILLSNSPIALVQDGDLLMKELEE